MPDNKSRVGEPDRSRVAGDQDYEVRYLAKKHGLSEQQALELSVTTDKSSTRQPRSS